MTQNKNLHIILPGQTRSKKNSKSIKYRWLKHKRVPFISSSDIYKAWVTRVMAYIKKQKYPAWSGKYPIEIKFFLFRANKRKWDIDNIFCGSLDVLQQAKIIIDDDAIHVIPVFSGWAIDKENPRVELLLCPPKKVYFRKDLCK